MNVLQCVTIFQILIFGWETVTLELKTKILILQLMPKVLFYGSV